MKVETLRKRVAEFKQGADITPASRLITDLWSYIGRLEKELDGYEGELPNDDDSTCALCEGTGIGQHGDPDTSKCSQCQGRGYLLRGDRDRYED